MAAIVILAGCAFIASLLEPPPAELSGRISASDGDSFHYGADRIRLLGIDAPELAQSCKRADGAVWPCGRVARDRLAALLSAKITCAQDGQDRFGRYLATCQSANRDIGAIMVSEGLAVSSDNYGQEEMAARAAKRGIWVGPFENPRLWRDENPRPAE
ncbi:thermonuclease family protein [Devosia sp.]|uniref:thermonuclease family protein n=1 Tax=Devosia sp. TaxID=1871048 RepID=UPI0032660D88